MYDCYHNKIVDGREEFPPGWIIGENLLYFAGWTLAGALLWPIRVVSGLPLLTILWAVLVIVIQIALKKHLCSGCYYYDRRCHLGWGKLAARLFPPDSGSVKLGMKLTMFYIIPPPIILLIALILAFSVGAGWLYWTMITVYLLLNLLTFPVRKLGCGQCTMRDVCAGSAVKGRQQM